jgi:transcriptional regulator with XRE-family HTH domain
VENIRKKTLRCIGERIAALRRSRGWSQPQLAAQLGRAVNSLSRWETGAQELGVLDALSLAAAFGVRVQDLLEPAPSIAALRSSPLYWVSPARVARLQTATTQAELAACLDLQPQIGVVVDPADVQVPADHWQATAREAAELWRVRAAGTLARLVERVRVGG